MATNNYITLTDSSGSGGKRFKAIEMLTPHRRTDNLEITIGGKYDKQSGPILKSYAYTLRVPIDSPEDPAYGDYEDLTYFFSLNNSSGSITDIIKLTDHYNIDHSCYFAGEMSPKPLTTMLEGVDAWHLVGITLMEIL